MTRPELSQGMPAGLTQSLANIGYLFSSLENEACCYGVPEEGAASWAVLVNEQPSEALG